MTAPAQTCRIPADLQWVDNAASGNKEVQCKCQTVGATTFTMVSGHNNPNTQQEFVPNSVECRPQCATAALSFS